MACHALEAGRRDRGARAVGLTLSGGWPPNSGVGQGMLADLVIFDPTTIVDRATFDRPHQEESPHAPR